MDRETLRLEFWVFLGDERFRRFVLEAYADVRLRYWQEREWARFLEANPDCCATIDDLRAAIRICHVHFDDLISEGVILPSWERVWDDLYERDAMDHFPRSGLDGMSVRMRSAVGEVIEILYCPTCRRIAKERQPWHAARVDRGEKGRLVRPINLGRLAQEFGIDDPPILSKARWKGFHEEVEAVLEQGGELWMWEGVRYEFGLAVIRDGIWVDSWVIGRF